MKLLFNLRKDEILCPYCESHQSVYFDLDLLKYGNYCKYIKCFYCKRIFECDSNIAVLKYE